MVTIKNIDFMTRDEDNIDFFISSPMFNTSVSTIDDAYNFIVEVLISIYSQLKRRKNALIQWVALRVVLEDRYPYLLWESFLYRAMLEQ